MNTASRYKPGGIFDDKNRYIEIWNAGVFMQYDKQPGGLHPLRIRSVDTGSGLERMLMTLNGFKSVYEVDLLAPIVVVAREQLSQEQQLAHLIADHIRSAAVIMAAGVQPSNTGAGYVLRRLIRRCVAATAHLDHTFDFDPVFGTVFAGQQPWQPDMRRAESQIRHVFHEERMLFRSVLDKGMKRLPFSLYTVELHSHRE